MFWFWPLFLPLYLFQRLLLALSSFQFLELPSAVYTAFETFLGWFVWFFYFLPDSTVAIVWWYFYFLVVSVKFLLPFYIVWRLVFRRK